MERLNVIKGRIAVEMGMCGNVLWGIGCLIICDYVNYSSQFHCTLIIFYHFTENR